MSCGGALRPDRPAQGGQAQGESRDVEPVPPVRRARGRQARDEKRVMHQACDSDWSGVPMRLPGSCVCLVLGCYG